MTKQHTSTQHALSAIERRIALKAEVATSDPYRRCELVRRAKELACWVPLLDPNFRQSAGEDFPRQARRLAAADCLLHRATRLVLGCPPRGSLETQAAHLLAKTLAGYFGLSRELALTTGEASGIWDWLKARASRHAGFHPWLATADQDPGLLDRVGVEIEALEAKIDRARTQEKYLLDAERLAQSIAAERGDVAHLWFYLDAAIGACLESGIPQSNIRLREALQPIMPKRPSQLGLSVGAESLLATVQYVGRPKPVPAIHPPRVLAPEIAEFQRLYQGKSLLLFGGQRREGALLLLEDHLLIRAAWISTRVHGLHDPILNAIRRPSTDIVVQLIRFSDHGIGPRALLAAQKAGKPFVRVPAGYSPVAIASAVLKQVR